MSLLLARVLRGFSAAKDTCLKELHVASKGKIVDFAGTPSATQATTSPSTTPRASSRSTSTAAPTLPSST